MAITKAQKFWLESDFVLELLNQIPAHVFWKDKNSVYLGCNKAFANSLGLSSQTEIVGKTDYDLSTTKEESDFFRADDKQVIESKKPKANIEESQTLPDGRKVTLLTNKVPLLDKKKKVIGILGIYYDISERKKKEEELQEAKEKAEAASRAKTIFLSNISHDIKTPISGIISTAEYLMHSILEDDNKARANDIVQSGIRLLELMIEVIEVSRLETKDNSRDKIKFKPKKLAYDVAQLLWPAILDKNLELDIQYDEKIPTYLVGNHWHIYRILLNLLSNAVKFTNEGTITISFEQIKETKARSLIKICVKDSGMGIPKDKQAAIFEQFTRLTPSYEGIYKGSGLGLFIVKQFISAMKGQISVMSEEGKGSVFTCIIPLLKSSKSDTDSAEDNKLPEIEKIHPLFQRKIASSSKTETHPFTNENKTIDSIKVLLVEDNTIAAKAAQSTLQMLGCDVDVASNGKDALALFKPRKYKLIYLDLGLPDMDGTEVASEIRSIENRDREETPIVALSAHVDDAIKQKCLSVGMNEIFSKPLMRDQAILVLKKQILSKLNKKATNNNVSDSDKYSDNTLQIIDLELGASIIHSNVNGAKEALKMLAATLPESKQEIDEAYLINDLDRLRKAAHKLHGGLSYCGAPRLKQAVRALDLTIREGVTDKLALLYQTFCSEVKIFLKAYEKL